MKSFAQSTMNELLGLYGYEHVAESDLNRIRSASSMYSPRSSHSSSGNSEGCLSPNSKHISDVYHRVCDSRNSQNSNHSLNENRAQTKGPNENRVLKSDQFKPKEDILKIFPPFIHNGMIATAMRDIIRSPPTIPLSAKTNSKSGSLEDEITCAWCRKSGNCAFSLQESDGTKRFCSEKCFAACRRANFKRSRAEEARENKSISPLSTSDIASSSKHSDLRLMELGNQTEARNGLRPSSIQDEISKKKPRLQKENATKSKHASKGHSSKHYSGRDLSIFEEHSRNKSRELYAHRNTNSQPMQHSPRIDSLSNSKPSFSNHSASAVDRKIVDSVRTTWPSIMKEKSKNEQIPSTKSFGTFPNSAQMPNFSGFPNGLGGYPSIAPHVMQHLSDFVPNPLLANPALFPGVGNLMLPSPSSMPANPEIANTEKFDFSSFMLGMLAAGVQTTNAEPSNFSQQKELPQNISTLLNAISASQTKSQSANETNQTSIGRFNVHPTQNEEKPVGNNYAKENEVNKFTCPTPMLLMPFPVPVPIPIPFPMPSKTFQELKERAGVPENHETHFEQSVKDKTPSPTNTRLVYNGNGDINDKIPDASTSKCNTDSCSYIHKNQKQFNDLLITTSNDDASTDDEEIAMAMDLSAKPRKISVEKEKSREIDLVRR